MQSYVMQMCGWETYVEASYFSGIALSLLNLSQFIMSVALGLADFSLTDFFGPCKILFAILGCLGISLLILTCLAVGSIINNIINNMGSLVEGPRSGIPFWATILLAIVHLGIHLAFTVIPIDDIPNNLNNIWVLSCIGMAIADVWIIFVAFKAKQEISSNVGYEEIA